MSEVKTVFRDLTDEEIAAYKRAGWIKLKSFIAPDVAESLFTRLTALMGPSAETAQHPDPNRSGGKEHRWNTFAPLSVVPTTGEVADDLFYSVSHSPELGKVLARLSGEPTRYLIDQSLVKMPDGRQGSEATPWHIDFGSSDRTAFSPPHGQIQVWFALRKVTPSQGGLRFIPGRSYTEKVARIIAENSVVDSIPLLEAEGVISEPLTLEVGDATIHGSDVWHSAPPNTSEQPRWGYLVSAIPASRKFTGVNWWVTDNVVGMKSGESFPDGRFPVLA